MAPTVGFIGLGNVGAKLAGSLLRNGVALTVRDLDRAAAQPFLDAGATWGDSPRAMAESCDVVITCLLSPAASAAVVEADDGLMAGLGTGKVWAEMSTTDEAEVRRLGALVTATGAGAVDCPVSGMDLNTTYEAIRISSGNSFVHETESQVILNGSRNINFTMDLVVKDMTLFQSVADRAGVPLELSPLIL